MRSVLILARWEVAVLLGGLFGIVLWKLLTGGISLSYLLDADVPDTRSPSGFRSEASAGRAQLLIVTLIVAAYYLWQVIEYPRAFPHVPGKMVATLGGSQALYLAGKARVLLKSR